MDNTLRQWRDKHPQATLWAHGLPPSFKRLTTSNAILGRRRVTMANAKQVADVSMSRQEPLGVLR